MANPYIIAEIGSVHDGSLGNACRLIEAAADCGADAVKFQTHIAEAETLADAPAPSYFSAESRMAYFRRTGFSEGQWRELASVARAAGVDFLSSPFSLEAVDLLERIGMVAYKIPSGEVSNIPLLEKIAETGKPVYLSSGMSDWGEVDQAMTALSNSPVTLMQCTSAYPCPPERVGLNVMLAMGERYRVPVGFSDHTLGSAAAVAAVAFGAVTVEKHFAFSRLMYGSDAKHSMEPGEFRRFCADLREAALIMACPVVKDDLRPFVDMKRIFEKSIVTATGLKRGTKLVLKHLAFKKPGDGIPASRYRELLGRVVKQDLPVDFKIRFEDIE
jgi:N-acetylneuraminate synthase